MAFLALAEKLRDDNVSDKFEAFGQMLTIKSVFALPPAKRSEEKTLEVSSLQINFTRGNRITKVKTSTRWCCTYTRYSKAKDFNSFHHDANTDGRQRNRKRLI